MNRFFRMRMMALAGTSLLALGAAEAQTLVSYHAYSSPGTEPNLLITSDYLQVTQNDQRLAGEVTSAVDYASILVFLPAGDAVTVESNELAASASGNVATSLAAHSTDEASQWGSRILSSQIAVAGVNAGISAGSGSVGIGSALLDAGAGAVAVEDNGIRASAQVNGASNLMQGLASASGGTDAGSATLQVDGNGDSTLSVSDAHSSLGNVQIVSGGASSATVADAFVTAASDQSGPAADAAVSVTGNEISAGLGGNSASNLVTDAEGGAGSSTIASLQTIGGMAEGGMTASVDRSHITVNMQASAISGAISVGGNALLATAEGNSVTNQLALAGQSEGSGSTASASTVGMSGLSVTASGADHSVTSAQSIIGADIRAEVRHNDGEFGGIGAQFLAPVTDAAISVAGNEVAARTTANNATNLLSASAAELTASFAISSAQASSNADIAASVANMAIGVALGATGLSDSAASVTENLVEAAATGNASASQLTLGAGTLAAGSGMANAGADTLNYLSTYADGGAALASFQSNDGGRVEATVSSLLAGIFETTAISASAVAVDGNAVVASATGNTGSSLLQLAGTEGTAAAAVASAQRNDATVTATVENTGITVVQSQKLSGASLSLGSNGIRATALGNGASNGLIASGFSRLTLGQPNASADGAIFENSAQAALALANDQALGGEVSASVTGAEISIAGSTPVSASTLTLSGNAMQAVASGNQAANVLNVEVTSLEAADATQADHLGVLVSRQTAGAAVLASGTSLHFLVTPKSVTDSTIAVSGNSLVAAADASFADNRLSVTGTTHGAEADASDVSFAVRNTQVTAADGTSTAVLNNVETVLSGNAAASTLSMTDNRQIAQARSNVALNSFALGVTSLQAGARLENSQQATADVSATVLNSQSRIGTGVSTATVQAVTGNSLQALGVANAAANSMQVASVSLPGSSGYSVLNGQTSSSAVTSLVDGSNIALGASGNTVFSGGVASVQGNVVGSQAIGNSADNRLAISALSSAGVIGGVSSMQQNSGAVTATVNNVGIGIAASGTGSFTVSGNTIRAAATGNSAVNSISRGN